MRNSLRQIQTSAVLPSSLIEVNSGQHAGETARPQLASPHAS